MDLDSQIAQLQKLKLEAAEREDFRAASNYKRQVRGCARAFTCVCVGGCYNNCVEHST